jgi:glycosyltransferase involved in cell wall biosynthesis
MKVLPHVTYLETKDTSSARIPVTVCMHLVNTARKDIRVMRDAIALVEAGFVVTIVDIESDRARSTEEDIRGVHLKHIFMPSYFTPTRFKPWFLVKLSWVIIYGIIQLLRVQANIYHAHVDKALPACYIAARLRRKPLIFDAPEMPLSDPNITRWRRLSTLAIQIFSCMLPYSAGVIASSSPTVREICNYYQIPEVTLIRNVPAYRSVPKSDRLRQYLNLNPEVRIALYQGNLQLNRSLDRLVYAASFLEPDIVIVMMGRDVAPTRSQLEALIAREGVDDRVKIIPPVPYDELLDWTASADIGLTIFTPDYSPNIRMTLPNKFFEYLMAGLPVLTSPLEAIVDIIETYDVGHVIHLLEPAGIGIAINKMFEDRATLARMHHHALNAARNEFYWEKECLKLVSLYHDIIETQNTKCRNHRPKSNL